jgi:hypothetical protein
MGTAIDKKGRRGLYEVVNPADNGDLTVTCITQNNYPHIQITPI